MVRLRCLELAVRFSNFQIKRLPEKDRQINPNKRATKYCEWQHLIVFRIRILNSNFSNSKSINAFRTGPTVAIVADENSWILDKSASPVKMLHGLRLKSFVKTKYSFKLFEANDFQSIAFSLPH